jgi:hypothetical protein
VVVIGRVSDQTRKRILLQIEEPDRALNVCQVFRVLRFEHTIPLAAHETESHTSQEFLKMQLANAEEVDNLTVKVVQHFHFRGFFVEEYLRSPCKGLDVGGMHGKNFNDLLG